MNEKTIYRVFFNSNGKAYELYARSVEQADMYGFVAVEGLLFGEKSDLLLDPSEESLKHEFSGVKRLLIPFQQITRIDEVEKQGRGKVVALSAGGDGTVVPIPPSIPKK